MSIQELHKALMAELPSDTYCEVDMTKEGVIEYTVRLEIPHEMDDDPIHMKEEYLAIKGHIREKYGKEFRIYGSKLRPDSGFFNIAKRS